MTITFTRAARFAAMAAAGAVVLQGCASSDGAGAEGWTFPQYDTVARTAAGENTYSPRWIARIREQDRRPFTGAPQGLNSLITLAEGSGLARP